jgi:hypothetical protein
MLSDPEFLLHQLEEALRMGIAEEMETAIHDVILAVRGGEMAFVPTRELEEGDYTADGLTIRDEAYEDLEDLADLALDFKGRIDYGTFRLAKDGEEEETEES